jgi:hypothetical protein
VSDYTKQGSGYDPGAVGHELAGRATAPAKPRPDIIAKLVGNGDDVTATPREREIAAVLRKLGAKMEREGYLPELRRRHMLRVMREECGR